MRKKGLKRQIGIFISLGLYFVYAVLLMVRTKALVESYGSEVNAVFQTANQIFSYFVLIESGMSMAYQFKLYEPINNHNIEKIVSLFSGLKISMRKIALKMLVLLIVVAVGYPFIMNRVLISTNEAGMMLFLLGLRLVIPYFTSMASKALLNVYDYRYLLDTLDSLAYLVITMIELYTITWRLPIYLILLIGCLENIIMGMVYVFLLMKLCSEVKGQKAEPDLEPERMTKDIFFLKMTGLLNAHIDTIILSIVNIMLVTPYQAYNMILSYASSVVNRIDENYRTKIGLKIERKDSDLYDYFQMFMAYHMIVASISVSMFASNINNLIYLWLGREFILSDFCVAMMSIYLIHLMTRDIFYLVRDGAGLYKESKWLSLREGIANLILSIILVRHWGIEGIIFATVFSTFVLFIPSNARLVYQVLNKRNTLWMDFLIIGGVSFALIVIFKSHIKVYEILSWGSFLLDLLKEGVLCLVVSSVTVILFKWRHIRVILGKD